MYAGGTNELCERGNLTNDVGDERSNDDERFSSFFFENSQILKHYSSVYLRIPT